MDELELELPPRLSLANLPTRIQHLERLSRELRGPEIYVKRDDETGADLSGNKVRKLEFLLAEARARNCDVVITCGGVQSNHCRATAVAARRLGMDSVLFLRGGDPGERDGNLLLSAMVGAELRFITPEAYAGRSELMSEAAAKARADGRRAYVIPEGGSNALGSFGYVTLFSELEEPPAAREFDHIVCAVGSGGTLAGLLIGARLLDVRTRIWGVNVSDSAAYFEARVRAIGEEFVGRFLGGATPTRWLESGAVQILEGYKGPAYAVPYPEELELLRRVARTEGLLLDPVYTGKAFYGLVEEIRRGRFRRGENVLFLHTGGVFSLFAYRDVLIE